MIEGDIRREKIIEIMSNQKEPVSGSDLAKKFSVSRQVIVQDIALLRATNKNILSTNKGYFLYNPGKGPRTVGAGVRESGRNSESGADELR